jgi:hypothetical protein
MEPHIKRQQASRVMLDRFIALKHDHAQRF